jgi:Peptidase_C39 like family
MRLRRRRVAYASRRPSRWTLPWWAGLLALAAGVVWLAPLTPSALAPLDVTARATEPVLIQSVAAGPPASVAVAVIPPVPPTASVPATATPLPVPTAPPTLTPAAVAVLASIKSDRTAQWVKNHTETPLRSGPADDAQVFTRLPQWSLLKQIDSRPDWLFVQYSGDGATRQPGPGWVKASDVGAVDAPTVWLRTARAGTVWSAANFASGARVNDVPSSALMEVIGADFIQGNRVHVRLPGDGRLVAPSEGWIDGDVVARTASPTFADLPVAYPDVLRADVRIKVPYRSQLDGSDYAGSNCGPTVLGMALESFGVNLPAPEVRGQVLNSENFNPNDDDAGSFIWALAEVAQNHGLRTLGLYEPDGGALHRWSTDEIRDSVRRGQPVIVQVVYRGLPGREDSLYYGDHYIIITGLLGNDFLYNDPIGGQVAHEVPGFDRLITPTQLRRAMRASDTPYAYTAFAISRS